MHVKKRGKWMKQIDEQVTYNQLDMDEIAILSLLLASGYLKYKHLQQAKINTENGKKTMTWLLPIMKRSVCSEQ